MEFLNKIELQGVVGRVNHVGIGYDTEVSFSVVTEQAEKGYVETTWFQCSGLCTKVPNLGKIAKGDHVHAIGRLRSKRYVDQNGYDRVSWDVLVQSIELLTPDKCDLEQAD